MDSDLNSEMVRRATAGSFSTLEVDRGLPAGRLPLTTSGFAPRMLPACLGHVATDEDKHQT